MIKGVRQLTSPNPTNLSLPLLGGFLILSLLCGLPSAFGAKSFKVGIVDPQAVMEKSTSGKRALATLKEHVTVRQKLLASDEEELKKMQEGLQDGKTRTEAETQVLQEQFQRKLQDYQRRGQEFQQEMAQKQKEMVSEFMNKIEAATKAVAERHGFALVIDKGSEATLKIVLFSAKGLDITEEVVKEVNRRYK